MRKTKIICTLGPATDAPGVLEDLIRNGMDVARFNFSHGTHPQQKERLDRLKEVRARMGVPVAALLDTKGPEIRLKNFVNGKEVLEAGQRFTLTTREVEGTKDICAITYKNLPQDVQVGTTIMIDDGLIRMTVEEKTDTDIVCLVANGGPVKDHKGVNVPGVHLTMPYMSAADREDLLFGVEEGFDFVACSFCRSAADVMEIRRLLEENGSNMRIIAKLENQEGVNNIKEILAVADGIMVARGDMGVEIDFTEIPVIQKDLIAYTLASGKHVITATQMLESMVNNPRPTRAEITDVANAIYDGTSAIMLSGESAVGKHPVEAVKTMDQIAVTTEADTDYVQRFHRYETDYRIGGTDTTTAIGHATVTTANDLSASAIITVTKSGTSARMISRFRPQTQIIGATLTRKVWRQLNLSWGVLPLLCDLKDNTDALFEHAVEVSLAAGAIRPGDTVIITAGIPLGVSGTTNMLKVHEVSE